MIGWFADAIQRFPQSSRRRIFIVYGTALIIGTHIPRFKLEGEGMIVPPDRILHVAAFGGLAVLITGTHFLGRNGPLFSLRNIFGSAGIALAWGCLTELTQQFLVPGRWANWWDVVSNVTGISVAILICLILRAGQQHRARNTA